MSTPSSPPSLHSPPSPRFTRCFFNKDHPNFQCCNGTENFQTHIIDECEFLGECCLVRTKSFPDSTSLRSKSSLSLNEIFSTLKRDSDKGLQFSLFSKKITKNIRIFLEDLGYVVFDFDQGTKVSWKDPGEPEEPATEYTKKVIEIIKETIGRQSKSGTIGFSRNLTQEVLSAVHRSFPDYSIVAKNNIIKYSARII